MKYKQHFLYQVGFFLAFCLIWVIIFALTTPLLLFFPVFYGVLGYLRWIKYQVVLDDNKLVLEYGVFTSHKEQIRIDKIQKIRVSRSLIQSVFKNLGTIQVETGNDLIITLENIENYQNLQEELEKRTNKN